MPEDKKSLSTRAEVLDNLNTLYAQLGPVKPASEFESLTREMQKDIFHLQAHDDNAEGYPILKNFEEFIDNELPALKHIETLPDSTEIKKKKLEFIRGTQIILSDYLR